MEMTVDYILNEIRFCVAFSKLKQEICWIRSLLLHSHMRALLNTGTFKADYNCELLIKLLRGKE